MTRVTFVSLCAAIWLLLVVVELVRRTLRSVRPEITVA